jgi:hypothetical protein
MEFQVLAYNMEIKVLANNMEIQEGQWEHGFQCRKPRPGFPCH